MFKQFMTVYVGHRKFCVIIVIQRVRKVDIDVRLNGVMVKWFTKL